MGWKHYHTVDPREPQVGGGLFGVHLLIFPLNFSFPNPSNLQHSIFSPIEPILSKNISLSLSQNAQKSPKNLHKQHRQTVGND